ncbi:MAG: monoheme cytochrome c5 ScyA [Gammaproteobacteria bacterium]
MKKIAVMVAAGALLGAVGAANADGEATYKKVCFACHDFGAAGAPKLTEKEKWAPRIAKGMDALLGSVKNGLNAMPPKGTCAACSDEELREAIEYIISRAQ